MGYYTDKQYSKKLPENAKKDLRILFFDSFLKDSERILDLGCSTGRVISLSPERIEGVDIDKKALEIAKSKGYNVKYADIKKKLPFKNSSFDVVYCSQVIEHLEKPLNLMKEINRILKKDGKAVLVTPDYLIASKNKKINFWDDYSHKTPFTRKSLKRLAYDAGFIKSRVYHFPSIGFRHLMRAGLLSKKTWIKLEKIPFVWKKQDLILEIVK